MHHVWFNTVGRIGSENNNVCRSPLDGVPKWHGTVSCSVWNGEPVHKWLKRHFLTLGIYDVQFFVSKIVGCELRVSVTFVSLVNWGSRLLRQNRIRVITKRVNEFREKKEDVHNYTSPSTHTCTKTELKFSPVRRDIGGLATNHVSENNFS